MLLLFPKEVLLFPICVVVPLPSPVVLLTEQGGDLFVVSWIVLPIIVYLQSRIREREKIRYNKYET
jgi:hypothetical protein